MIKSLSMSSLLPVALVLVTCSLTSLAQQLTCQSNGCDSCCVTSDYCSTEHTPLSEDRQCRSRSPPLPLDTPLIPGLEYCPFDPDTGDYGRCPNSRVNNQTKSVGNCGKPNWVGAEFQSIAYDTFSMMVMWAHTDAETLKSLRDLSPPQGYEVRIYQKKPGSSEVLRHCFCVTDPSMRNISDIRSHWFEYDEMSLSHMIVEVKSFPSFIGDNENNNKRRNCSLLTGCATTNKEECIISRDDCYSWPQSCLDFLPSYNPETCAPPLYGPPVNVTAVMTSVDDNDSRRNIGQLNLSWEPPRINYELFPVPSTYYVTIESDYSTFNFKAVETTKITVLPLNFTSPYRVYVSAYVPCSGLSQSSHSVHVFDAGCGHYTSTHVTYYLPSCEDATPPLHGWLGDYQSTSLYSTVTFQCDSGWWPSEQFTTTCTDQLKWVPDPALHTCSDIDECLEGNHNCSQYAGCENIHGGFNCKCNSGYEGDGMTCKFSSGVIVGTSIFVGLVAAIALFLLMVASICLITRMKRVRMTEQTSEKGGKIELDEKQNNSVLDTMQTSLKSNPPPKMIKISVNLSQGEFTGEGYKGHYLS